MPLTVDEIAEKEEVKANKVNVRASHRRIITKKLNTVETSLEDLDKKNLLKVKSFLEKHLPEMKKLDPEIFELKSALGATEEELETELEEAAGYSFEAEDAIGQIGKQIENIDLIEKTPGAVCIKLW